MAQRTVIRWIVTSSLSLAVLLVAAFIAFVPPAREPAYPFGPGGNIFAADFYNDRIQKYTPDGTFLTDFGDSGAGPGQFGHPVAVAVTGDGTVFVTDFLNHRVQKWRPSHGSSVR